MEGGLPDDVTVYRKPIPFHELRGYIQALIAHCRASGLTPIAGCYYYNHNSKKTLEKAGMYSKTRLFKAQL